LKLLVITNLFPNRIEPERGIFNYYQLFCLQAIHKITVVAPVPWFPRLLMSRYWERWSRFAKVPKQETINGIKVYHPRYLMIPWAGRTFHHQLFGAGINRLVRGLCEDACIDALVATWAYPDIVASARLAEKLRLPFFAKVHGSDIDFLAWRPRRRRAVGPALRGSRKVICVSDTLRAKVNQLGVPLQDIALIRNGVDQKRFRIRSRNKCREALGVPHDRPMILFVGSLDWVKGGALLPRVVAALTPVMGHKPLLYMIGAGPLRSSIEQEIEASGLWEDVHLLGQRPHAEVPLWLGAANVLCVPSREEGCPNIILEALACGRPVVATKAGGIPEVVRDGENGVLVAVEDTPAMAASLQQALAKTWDARAIRRSVSARGWEETAREIDQLLCSDQQARTEDLSVLHVLNNSIPHVDGYSQRSRAIVVRQKTLGMHPVVVTSARQGSMNDIDSYDGIDYHRSRVDGAGPETGTHRSRTGDLKLMRALYRDIRRVCHSEKIRVIHAHSPVLCALPAWLAARRLGLPFVYEIRALWEDAAVSSGKTSHKSVRYISTRRLETFLSRRADRLVVICLGLLKEFMARKISHSRIDVVLNGVDSRRFRRVPASARINANLKLKGHTVIGFIGSVFKFEGVSTLIDAAPFMIKAIPKLRILIVGDGEQFAELKSQTTRLGLDEHIIFTGRVPNTQISNYYSVMDIIVYPRLRERITEMVTPLKPLEAMAQGRPVVASDVGGLKELINDGETGVLFRAGDARDLADKCVDLLRDPGRSQDLANNARRQVQQQRDWRAVTGTYLSTYWKIVA